MFFSGGSALDGLSRVLKHRTSNSVHLLTPFDSGGSSAVLRRAFRMPAIGDVRCRLTALADEERPGVRELCALLSHRFPAEAESSALRDELAAMIGGKHRLVGAIPTKLRWETQSLLEAFETQAGADFDLRFASIGNLVMAGAYLLHDRSAGAAIKRLSEMLHARGTVLLTADVYCELFSALADGTTLVGQHRLTGRSEPPIGAAVSDIYLVDPADPTIRVEVVADPDVLKLVETADLIVYPIGSFYSSLVANLLPRGVGRAIASTYCRKVYVPNMGHDPEQQGLTVGRAVEQLVRRVRLDAGEDVPVDQILNVVVLDTSDAVYESPLELERVRDLGINVLRTPLREDSAETKIDSKLACETLLELSGA